MSRKGHPFALTCVLNCLRTYKGQWVGNGFLLDAIWADCGLREPVDARVYMRKQITLLRKAGHQIQTRHNFGYRLIREAT